MEINNKQIESLLKNFEFYKLDKISENVNSDFKKAIYAVVNTIWWRDDYFAQHLLDQISSANNHDTTLNFLQALGYLSCGKLDEFKQYFNKLKKNNNTPKWQKEWLQIEYLGRTIQEENQIVYIKKLFKKYKKIDRYIIGATLNSLMHKKADISFLKNFTIELLKENNINSDIRAFAARCGLLCKEDQEDNIFTNYYLADYFFKEKINAVETLKLLDNMAHTMFLDINMLNRWLGLSTLLPQAINSHLDRLNYAYSNSTNNLSIKGMIASYLMIYYFKKGDYNAVYSLGKKHESFANMKVSGALKNSKVYFNYVVRLCYEWQKNKQYFKVNSKKLYVFGESHSLSFSNVDIELDNNHYNSINCLIPGIKMYHLSYSRNYFYQVLSKYISYLRVDDDIIFTIGEIDTRQDEGIWKTHKDKNKSLDEIINSTVNEYINFLFNNLYEKKLGSVTIQGVPAPGYELDSIDDNQQSVFLKMIKTVNYKLKELTLINGWNFLDVYSATVSEDGKSNKKWHIDDYHLNPIFYAEEANKWLIKPELKQQTKPTTMDFSKYKTVALAKPS